MNSGIKYGKVSLRALEPEDIALLYQWENNMEIWELSNTQAPISRHILAQYLKESAKDIYEAKQLRLVIQDGNMDAVGAVDLFDFDPYHLRAGVGILVHKLSDRGKGYASDAVMALSGYAMNVLGLRQLYANISADNEASIRLFEKTGFEKTGTKKDWLKTLSGWKDEFLYQKVLV